MPQINLATTIEAYDYWAEKAIKIARSPLIDKELGDDDATVQRIRIEDGKLVI